MKKAMALTIVSTVASATFGLACRTTMNAKVGDELYICGCGEGPKCNTISQNPGNSSCGKKRMKVKAKAKK